MPDRITETHPEMPEIPQELEQLLTYCVTDARQQIEADGELIAFTALAVGETVFIEQHDFEEPEQCYSWAQHTVQNTQGARCYAFCYDGYIEIDDQVVDAIIAEGGQPGADHAYAIGLLYDVDESGAYAFEAEMTYVGEAPNFMIALAAPGADVDAVESENSDAEADPDGDDAEGAEDMDADKDATLAE